jgi:hypothetical protein
VFARFRGTVDSPEAVQTNDQIYNLRFFGYDGTSSQISTQIRGEIDGTVSAGIVPGRLRFLTTNSSGAQTSAFTIDSEQTVDILRKLSVNNAAFEVAANRNGQTSNLQVFTRSRGTVLIPTAVQNNDHIYTIRFAAFDGTSNQAASQIRAEVNATPTLGVVQGRLRLLVADTSGVQQTAMVITSSSTTIVNNLVAQAGVTGNTTGTHTGAVVGFVTGDIKGSVFGDDSTTIVDAVENKVFAEFFGDLTATNVTSTNIYGLTAAGVNISVNGFNNLVVLETSIELQNVSVNVQNNLNVTGTLNVGTIDTTDSSAITVVPAITFNSDVTIENELFIGTSRVMAIDELKTIVAASTDFADFQATSRSRWRLLPFAHRF